ncbi:hypothetical protein [Nitrosomonas sp.]|uniref:hypothetical protein n=1 Tax=Nitrosomonas sp. TaxID=42353 RepID=UPI001E1549E9|nr:hypothetical protein [Nitrosomonas sp.]MCB1948796.1 hypothetical protein [Nitrosomonas sp.]
MTTKAAAIIVSSQSNAANGTTRGTIDLRSADYGAHISMTITNGSTGPTDQCEGRVLVAYNDGATPAAAGAGADWKTIFVFSGGVDANAVTEMPFNVDAAIQHLEVEFTGNTGQAVTVEAVMTTLSA